MLSKTDPRGNTHDEWLPGYMMRRALWLGLWVVLLLMVVLLRRSVRLRTRRLDVLVLLVRFRRLLSLLLRSAD